jgi:hypothetical protein
MPVVSGVLLTFWKAVGRSIYLGVYQSINRKMWRGKGREAGPDLTEAGLRVFHGGSPMRESA